MREKGEACGVGRRQLTGCRVANMKGDGLGLSKWLVACQYLAPAARPPRDAPAAMHPVFQASSPRHMPLARPPARGLAQSYEDPVGELLMCGRWPRTHPAAPDDRFAPRWDLH